MLSIKWVKGSVIGRGSFGTVAIACAIQTDFNSLESALVAVKSASVDSSSSLVREGMFLNELRGCPEIVCCFGEDESLENGKKIYNLFLEHAPGGTLDDVIIWNRNCGIPEFNISCCAYMILRGLKYIHSRGYVHCDIKPSNILVFPSEKSSLFQLKIVDFGLAKVVGTPSRLSINNGDILHRVRGTLAYNSPESVLHGQHEAPMDIWAFGISILKMLTAGNSGYPYYEDTKDLLLHIGYDKNFPEVPDYIPKKAKEFLRSCLIRDPVKRWTADMLLKHPFIADNDLTHVDVFKAKKVIMKNPLAQGGDLFKAKKVSMNPLAEVVLINNGGSLGIHSFHPHCHKSLNNYRISLTTFSLNRAAWPRAGPMHTPEESIV